MIKTVDYLIIGAGPAGLQLGYFLQKQQRDYLILERSNKAGSFFENYPRHGQLISINKVFTGYDDPEINLRWDWNSLLSDDTNLRFTRYTKQYFPENHYMVQYMNDFAERWRLNIDYNTEVSTISRDGYFYVQTTDGREYKCKRLISATGVSKANIPDIPGIEHTYNYTDVPIEKEPFENKSVLIIGKGNSGFEAANYLIDAASFIHIASPTPLKMAWRSHYVGDLRAVNNNFLDTYQLKSQNGVINGHVTHIEPVGDKYRVTISYNLASGEVEKIDYDHVIACTGFRYDASVFDDSCRPKLAINDRFPAQTSYYESVNVPDLYFAGTINQQRDFKQEQSGFIHGFRYNIWFLANYLAKRYHGDPMPGKTLGWDVHSLAHKIIDRVNITSGLWQQTGYLCDVAALSPESKQVQYLPCMPVEYPLKNPPYNKQDILVITLQFGQERINRAKNVFAIERVHKHESHKAHLSTGIHPIVRHYHNGRFVSEHHVLEDFFSEWKEPEHTNPLIDYLRQVFNQLPGAHQKETVSR